MKKQISLIILVFILGHFSCNKSSCDGERLKSPPYYDIKGLRNDISRITRNSVKPVENDTIAYHNLSLRINADVNYYFTKRNGINFGNLAFACEPQPHGYLGTKEMLEDLIITSNFDFDDLHPKGSNLKDLFSVLDDNKNISLTEYLSKKPLVAPQYLHLRLRKKPTTENQKFKIAMYLSTDEQYFTETITIKIK